MFAFSDTLPVSRVGGSRQWEKQVKLYRQVVLDKEELGVFSLWYRGLTETEAAEWDKSVVELKPTAEPADRPEAFRFTTDPPAEAEKVASLSDKLRTMIRKNLEDAKPTQAPDARE